MCGIVQVILVRKLYASRNMQICLTFLSTTRVRGQHCSPAPMAAECTHSKCFFGARQALQRIIWIATFPLETCLMFRERQDVTCLRVRKGAWYVDMRM